MNTSDTDARRTAALAFLLGRIDYERALTIPYDRGEFRLDRMRQFLARLNNPQEKLKIVHVAGTKGKGSTSAMLAAALTACGYRTGLYTSPHLDKLEERIRIDGVPCSGDEFAALVERVKPVVESLDEEFARVQPPELGPTYFEVITAMALLHFVERQTDVAVLEVGLGGRLDSTNVCRPLVSVITSISYDHTKQLGDTLAAIAREKAGIIKPVVSVVSGVMDAEPRDEIAAIAQQCGSRLVQAGRDFNFVYYPPQAMDCDSPASELPRATFDFIDSTGNATETMQAVKLGLLGGHQAANAAVALATLNELRAQGWQLPEVAVRRGLAELSWPARVEIVSRRPLVVVDAAHNTASVRSLVETLEESFHAPRRLLVFATTQDKDVAGMLRLLLPKFDTVVLTRYLNNPRAVSVADLKSLVAQQIDMPCYECADPAEAWRKVRELAQPADLVCITGSFFLAAEMRAEIAKSNSHTGD